MWLDFVLHAFEGQQPLQPEATAGCVDATDQQQQWLGLQPGNMLQPHKILVNCHYRHSASIHIL
jgi:hypothetical protein